ncbi:MAG TPA: hypothetical protein PKD51_03910 [Saprospiraceae bacterium]|nr:hypothetical protein [Saprospiraceae bacterium]
MELLKTFGALGFWFFFIKGLLWLLLFALVYFGLVDKAKIKIIKDRLSILKKKGD